MSTYIVSDNDLVSVADAIRTKGGTTESLAFPNGFIDAIDNIQTGGGGDVGYDLNKFYLDTDFTNDGLGSGTLTFTVYLAVDNVQPVALYTHTYTDSDADDTHSFVIDISSYLATGSRWRVYIDGSVTGDASAEWFAALLPVGITTGFDTYCFGYYSQGTRYPNNATGNIGDTVQQIGNDITGSKTAVVHIHCSIRE